MRTWRSALSHSQQKNNIHLHARREEQFSLPYLSKNAADSAFNLNFLLGEEHKKKKESVAKCVENSHSFNVGGKHCR
jgi:iron-sulfur cluster repair protein YtfE (RIC family)